MHKYFLTHSADELDEAVEKVLSGYKNVSVVTAIGNDVRTGKVIVDKNGNVVNGSLNTTDYYNEGYQKGLEDATSTLQSKTVTPSKSVQSVSADSGYDGLSKVIVNAIPQSILDAEYQRGYDEAFELYKPYKQELLHIESSGTQFIDTGFIPNQDTRVTLSAYNTSTSSGWTYGVWESASSKQFCFSCLSTYSFRYGTSGVSLITVPVGSVEVDQNKNVYNLNGTTGTIAPQTFTCSNTMYLFCINANGSPSGGKFSGKLYSCKIYDNGTLVRDYIPVLDWDNVPCLYDKVTRKLYHNIGSGTFTYA